MPTDSIKAPTDPKPVSPPIIRSATSYVDEYVSSRWLFFPSYIAVPTFQPVPTTKHARRDTASSSASHFSTSSTYSTPDTSLSLSSIKLEPVSIKWSTANLYYLISILHRDLVLSGRVHFVPTLEELPDHGDVNLIAYANISQQASSQATYTHGFHTNCISLAESGRCTDPLQARKAIAASLLRDLNRVNDLRAKCSMRAALFTLPSATLESVLRTIPLMERETSRSGRSKQLKDVDETYEIGSILDAFFIGPAWEELGRKCAEYALSLEEKLRMWMGETYAAAVTFLARAVDG